MTTPAAEAAYEAFHQAQWAGQPVAIFNPNDKPISELPAIYGFNNGGRPGWMQAALIAQDGTYLGGHTCSSEGYMPHDLGIIEGARPDRHEEFQQHYPGGYRMEFIPGADVSKHAGLDAACKANQEKAEAKAEAEKQSA